MQQSGPRLNRRRVPAHAGRGEPHSFAAPGSSSLLGLTVPWRQAPVKVARVVRAVAKRLPARESTATERIGPAAGWGLDLAPLVIVERDASLDSERAVRLDRDLCAGQGLASWVRWCRHSAGTPASVIVPSTAVLTTGGGRSSPGAWSATTSPSTSRPGRAFGGGGPGPRYKGFRVPAS